MPSYVKLQNQCRDALIRHRNVGQQDVGTRGAILNQSRDALFHTAVMFVGDHLLGDHQDDRMSHRCHDG